MRAGRGLSIITWLVTCGSIAGCGLGGPRLVSETVGQMTVTREARDPSVAGSTIEQSAAQASALAEVSRLGPDLADIAVVQATLVPWLVHVGAASMAYDTSSPEMDWVFLVTATSPGWAHANVLVAVDALSGKVQSSQIARFNEPGS